MNKFLKFYCIIISIMFSTLAMAQNTISIQSTLKSISGDALPDGPKTVMFNLYNAGGNSLWNETASVEVVSGIYSHELGSVTALNPSDFGIQLYLGVTIDGTELLPRTKLGYAPYAMSVNSLAASGQSASFDGNGKFNVSKDMSVATTLNVGGAITSGGGLVANGALTAVTNITNSGTISSTGNITSNNNIISSEQINAKNLYISGGSIGVGVGPTISLLDIALSHIGTGMDAQVPTKLKFHVNNETTPKMVIQDNGRVGIGTDNPQTMLHVTGAQAVVSPASGSQFTGFTEQTGTFNTPDPIAIVAYFDGFTLAKGSFVGNTANFSDKRIKTNLHLSNAKSDLALLNKIEITEYDHIDKQSNNLRQKKVIAQQIAEVLPNATTKTRMVIPNVYKLAKSFDYKAGTLSVQTDKAHDFVVGDKIDLKTPKKDLDNIEVIAVIDEHTFSVKVEEKPENVFVYGKYVDDFLCVDYDAIAMLNVSATQEMYRMIMDLQQANKNLIKENEELKSSSASIEDRLSRLEAMMVRSESKTTNITSSAGR